MEFMNSDYDLSGRKEEEKSCGKCRWSWGVTRAMVNAARPTGPVYK
ncbi:hypothetical protein PV797_12625 [Clostridiaceae bacterium M8S5]|nr:hypothetical protein PV797_12625 [Clostridiaceae bacterium M8S5]